MDKFDLAFGSPLLNSAGVLGFAPDAQLLPGLPRLGAFFTHPISLEPRSPSHPPRCLPFPGGFLLHTGWPNPGIRAVLKSCRARWARAGLPVIVHLLALSPAEAKQMVSLVEGLDGVLGIELGLPPGLSGNEAAAWVSAAAGELPVIARLPLNQAAALAPAVITAGAAAVSFGALRGALPAPSGQLVQGRLYGPALFPHTLGVVHALAQLEAPLLASGGVYTSEQADVLLKAGAAAVQLDAVLWKGVWQEQPPPLPG